MVPYCSCCLCLYLGSSIMLVTYFVNFRQLNDHLFGKELFILFAASAFRKLSSIYVFSYFPFGFEGRIWDLIVSVPDHCLSFYFKSLNPHKAAGPDKFKPMVLQTLHAELAPILQVIFQKSLDSEKLPHIWKEANVSPIFKTKETSQTLQIIARYL